MGMRGKLLSFPSTSYWSPATAATIATTTAMTTAHTGGGPPEERPYGYHVWLDDGMPLAGGWAGQHLLVVPDADAVVVVTGDAGFDPGPPPTDAMPPDWQPALGLVRAHLLPVLRGTR